jgi:hypothetical protein
MGRRNTAWAICAVLAVSFLFIPVSHGAQSDESSDTDYLDALWVAEPHHVTKIAAQYGELLFELSDSHHMQAHAVDPHRGVFWGYVRGELRAYAFDGQMLRTIEVSKSVFPYLPFMPVPGSDIWLQVCSTVDVKLVVDPVDGAVWLGMGRCLLRTSKNGNIEQAVQLEKPIRSLALDSDNQLLWVATRKTLTVYDQSGNQTMEVISRGRANLTDISYDRHAGEFWVANHRSVRRYSLQGEKTFEVSTWPGIRALAADGQGGVWLAGL